MGNYPKSGLAIVDKSLQSFRENLNGIRSIQKQRNQQEPRVKPQFLEPRPKILSRILRSLKITSIKNRFIEDIGFNQKLGLTSSHIMPKVKLTDPASDLANFPAVETRFNKLGAKFLLVLPETHISLENLMKVVMVVHTPVGRDVLDPSELPVGALHHSSEALRFRVFVGHSGGLNSQTGSHNLRLSSNKKRKPQS